MKKKKRGNRLDIVEEYKKCWKYLGDSKNFIYIMIGVFSLFIFIGAFIQPPKEVYDQLIEFLKNLVKETQSLSLLGLIKFIIANNVQSTFFAWIAGIIFGIFPILNAILNGYVLGFVGMASVNADGVLSLWRILPHGIFELPAVFISLGLGLKFGTFMFHKKKLDTFKDYFFNSLRVFLLVVIPLLVIAGIIEGTLIYLTR